MPTDFSEILVGVSSRALFDLEKVNEVFDKEGIEGFRKFQLEHEYGGSFKGQSFESLWCSYLLLRPRNPFRQFKPIRSFWKGTLQD